jgi:hypothetical protein
MMTKISASSLALFLAMPFLLLIEKTANAEDIDLDWGVNMNPNGKFMQFPARNRDPEDDPDEKGNFVGGGRRYPAMVVEEGDTINFNYVTGGSEHNVYEFPDSGDYRKCDFDGATEKCSTQTNGSESCSITFNSVGTYYYGCDVAHPSAKLSGQRPHDHCEHGQRIKIRVRQNNRRRRVRGA